MKFVLHIKVAYHCDEVVSTHAKIVLPHTKVAFSCCDTTIVQLPHYSTVFLTAVVKLARTPKLFTAVVKVPTVVLNQVSLSRTKFLPRE